MRDAIAQEIIQVAKELIDKIKVTDTLNWENPAVLGATIYLLLEERRKMNELLIKILTKLEQLETALKTPQPEEPRSMLSEVDQRIMELVREKGMVTAEDVRKALGYKGRNAASARLNSLYERGFLRKIRAGRKVYYTI